MPSRVRYIMQFKGRTVVGAEACLRMIYDCAGAAVLLTLPKTMPKWKRIMEAAKYVGIAVTIVRERRGAPEEYKRRLEALGMWKHPIKLAQPERNMLPAGPRLAVPRPTP